jgi:hypothetical protein
MIGPADISADDSGKTFFISQNPPLRTANIRFYQPLG